jgi:hypothetical protein
MMLGIFANSQRSRLGVGGVGGSFRGRGGFRARNRANGESIAQRRQRSRRGSFCWAVISWTRFKRWR